MLKSILTMIVLLVAGNTYAQQYVFYLHGAIVEGTKTDPISQGFGRYEYDNIIRTLRQHGYVVLSERRPANTVPEIYALKVAGQIDSLKKKGVKSNNIAVIGASKGAGIAMLASGFAKDKNVKYILMAGCHDNAGAHYDLYGHVLSIYEKSDPFAGSCRSIKNASQGIGKYKEIELNTHKKHGFLYTPLKEWVQPAVAWIGK